MSEFDYDLFVIGAGSGGVRASRIAAMHGAKVAVAEEYRVGGTCVIRGCVPKKLLVYASRFSEDFEDAAGFGWNVGEARFDWATLIANKDREIDRLNGLYIRNLEKAGVEIIDSRAVLKDAHTVHLVKQNRIVTAATILIATGGTPFKPTSVPGVEHAITSSEAFHLKQLPKRAIMVGGGYIAIEFAGIFNGLGVDATLMYRRDRLLRGFDHDLREGFMEEVVKKGVNLLTWTDITKIERKGDVLLAHIRNAETRLESVIETDLIMYATGRLPNTEGMGLEEAGVTLKKSGAVEVDPYSQTSVPNIYAVGDVTDRKPMTPIAIREGQAFAETVFNGNPIAVDHSLVPTAVFGQPELGTVGLTEEAAREHYGEIDIYKTSFRPMKHTMTGRQDRTFMKLVVDTRSQRVLGVHLMGAEAGEIIQSVAIAVTMGATKKQFDMTIAVHPTAAEELVTLKEKWQPSVKNAAE